MSQNTTRSVKDLLPDNCFLNLKDDDNETLDLVTDVNNIHYPSSRSDLSRWDVTVMSVKVVGVTMDINPSSIILGDQRPNSQPVETLFRCGNPAGTNIKTLLGLIMFRLTKREKNGERRLLAQIREGGGGVESPGSVTDIQNRATEEGAVDKQNYKTAFVSLKFNTNQIMCQDAGYYYCELYYEDGDLKEYHENNTMSFSTSALPSDVILSAPGWNNPATMKVNQAIDLRCEGKIGNDPNTKVKWKRTSPSTGLLSAFTPESYPNAIEDQGQVTELPNECSNRRVATLNYNITVSDQNSRFESLQFQCYIEANGFQVNSTVFSIKIEAAEDIVLSLGGELGTGNPCIISIDDKDTESEASRQHADSELRKAVWFDQTGWPPKHNITYDQPHPEGSRSESPDTGETSKPEGVLTCPACESVTPKTDNAVAIVASCLGSVIAVLTILSVALILLLVRQRKLLTGQPAYELPMRPQQGSEGNYDALQETGDYYEVPRPTAPPTNTQ